MSRALLIPCVALSLSSGCKEQEPLPEPAPTPKSVLMVADKSVETPVKLAIGTKGERSLRVVLSSAPLTCAKLRKSYPERPSSGKAFVLDFWLVRPLEQDGKLGDWSFRSAYLEDGEGGRGLAARAALLDGVRFHRDVIETETVVMRSITGTVRWIRAEHRQLEKFHLD